MPASKILLVLGSGHNIGRSLANEFKIKNYKVALVSRGATDGLISPEGFLNIQADLSQPSTIPSVFEAVRRQFGGPPNVVVYNAAALTVPTDPDNLFSVPLPKFEADLAVLNTTAYYAAQEAVAGFEEIGNSGPRAFIYTGNILAAVTTSIPRTLTLGTGKSAASYWIGAASAFFKDKGHRFVIL